MNKLKSVLKLCVFTALAFTSSACLTALANDEDEFEEKAEVVHQQWYELKMKLHVPRIYDNSHSLGKRKYQCQTIKGYLSFDYSKDGDLVGMSFMNLFNKTHRLSNGKHVTYDGYLDESKPFRVSAIGNNRTQKFNVASICFSLMAEPSYNIGQFDEDTSLFVTLAGKGTIRNEQIKNAKGSVAGTLGCGCYAYGHVSPTRIIWWYGISDIVTDVAAVHGSWRIRRIK